MKDVRIRDQELRIRKLTTGNHSARIHHSRFMIRGGFTLLEMLVSIGIFSVVVVSSIGVILSIGGAQNKASNVQNIQDNVRFAMELMTKEIRQGKQYDPKNCIGSACTELRFSFKGETVIYCVDSGVIKRRVSAGGGCQNNGSAITSDDVVITRLLFYTVGQQSGPSDGQPRVTVVVEGRSVSPKIQFESKFNLQTTVTQRIRDI